MLIYKNNSNSVHGINEYKIKDKKDIIWAHFDSDKKSEMLDLLEMLKIHPLAKGLILKKPLMPRIDIYKNEAFISCIAIKENYSILGLNIIVGSNFVLSYTDEEKTDLFSDLENDFRDHPEHMSHTGHILYHILDKTEMFYLKVVDKISDEIEIVEKRVFKSPFSKAIGKEVYNWKGKVHDLRQVVEAHSNVVESIGRSDFPYINEDSGFYFKDLLENYSRVTEAFDTFKEDLSSIFNLQISLKSDRLNNIMRVLTLVSVVFIPMTFIAGLYGMNFEYMPELKWDFGYFYSLILMFGLGAAIALYFKSQGWWGKPKEEE